MKKKKVSMAEVTYALLGFVPGMRVRILESNNRLERFNVRQGDCGVIVIAQHPKPALQQYALIKMDKEPRTNSVDNGIWIQKHFLSPEE